MENSVDKKVHVRNDGNLDLKTLFVRSIPFDATDEEFTNFFSQIAPIKHAVIVKDSSGESRGFGFVSFAAEDDTKQALIQARKTKFKNRPLRIDIAKRRDRSKKDIDQPETATDNIDEPNPQNEDDDEDSLMKGKPRLIIRNMPWSYRDPKKLTQFFSRFGTVVDSSIPKKPDGRLCGFAFVTMKKISACKRAIDAKNLEIDGRKIAVDFAIQKNRWDDYKKTQMLAQEVSSDVKEIKPNDSSDNFTDTDNESDLDDDSDDNEMVEKNENLIEPKNHRETFSVFVRNVPYDATQETLEEHFSKFGPVKYALPVLDKETGLSKGTAFVVFNQEKSYNDCINNAPAVGTTSLLISDDVLPQYVYEGRVLSIVPTLDRDTANKVSEKNAMKRKETLGIAPGEKDKRNLYLLNEGRIVESSKLAQLISSADMEVREKSYKLRVEQLKKNPSLHLSLTRLAIRNIPRSMTEKALKALARKAVVTFAKEVKEGKRHPLSKEEIVRSTKEKYRFMTEEEIEASKKRDKKSGVVKQSKIIMEVKGSTIGRSRGYGFVEFRDHKTALMGLRWLNAHEVTPQEILEGLNEEEQNLLSPDNLKKRRLVVEFAIENANVMKRRREKVKQVRESVKRKRNNTDIEEPVQHKRAKYDKKSILHQDTVKKNKDFKTISNDQVKSTPPFKRKSKKSKK